jgi:hypothetical protein
MGFLARICKRNMLAPEKQGLAPELFLVLSAPDLTHSDLRTNTYIIIKLKSLKG